MSDLPRRRFLSGIVTTGAIGAAAATAVASASSAKAARDPVFALIEEHRAAIRELESAVDDQTAEEPYNRHENRIQLLGRTAPTTLAGAAAQLLYMADFEGHCVDEKSPILRTMATVAASLVEMGARTNG